MWTSDKLIPTSIVHPFRSNVIDFDSQPRCWAGCAFDYVHYSVPRAGLDDIAEHLGFGRVTDYRLAVLEDDLVVAQITKRTIPFLGRPSLSACSRSIQSHPRSASHPAVRCTPENNMAFKRRPLAPWQKRRATEILHENMHDHIRLSDVARECGLSVSHFARSFKTSFGISTHQWLVQHRIDHAKQLMSQTSMSLIDVAILGILMTRQRSRAHSINSSVLVPEDGDGITQQSIRVARHFPIFLNRRVVPGGTRRLIFEQKTTKSARSCKRDQA